MTKGDISDEESSDEEVLMKDGMIFDDISWWDDQLHATYWGHNPYINAYSMHGGTGIGAIPAIIPQYVPEYNWGHEVGHTWNNVCFKISDWYNHVRKTVPGGNIEFIVLSVKKDRAYWHKEVILKHGRQGIPKRQEGVQKVVRKKHRLLYCSQPERKRITRADSRSTSTHYTAR